MKRKLSSFIAFLFSAILVSSNINIENINASTFNYNDVLVGVNNLNNTSSNSAKIGEQLIKPEIGWKRYDDKNSKIESNFSRNVISGKPSDEQFYMGNYSGTTVDGQELKFTFKGQKVRIIGARIDTSNGKNHTEVYADGQKVSTLNIYGYPGAQYVLYEYKFSSYGVHNVNIKHIDPSNGSNPLAFITSVDAIDIDGELIDNIINQNGWVNASGEWYYYKDNQIAKGWLQDNNSWYLLDSNDGHMLKEWQQINGTWYYLDPVYGYMRTNWQQINGAWYYLDPTYGYMRTSWQQIGGTWYYFYSSGAMATNTVIDGWKIDSNGVATKL